MAALLTDVVGRHGTVRHDPEGFAPNMGFVVICPEGKETYRGPQWCAHIEARTNIPFRDQIKP